MEDPRQTSVNGSLRRNKYNLINYKRKITMVRTSGKNVRKKILWSTPEGKRSTGKPRKNGWTMLKIIWRRWMLRGWRNTVRDRDAWKLILKESKVHWLQSQWTVRGEGRDFLGHSIVVFLIKCINIRIMRMYCRLSSFISKIINGFGLNVVVRCLNK